MTGSKEHGQLEIGLAQVKPKKSDLLINVSKVNDTISNSCGGTDILVFSETNLSGYFLEGGVAEVSLSARELIEVLGVPPANCPDVVLGFYEKEEGRYFNSVAYLEPDATRFQLKHIHRKLFLPTYGVFDESRFVQAGTEIDSFSTKHGRIG